MLRILRLDGDVAFLDLAGRARQVLAAAADDVRRVAGAAAAEQRDLERRVEEVGDALLVALGGRAEQPHQQEERHHRGDEVGVGDLPRAAVLAVAALADPLDDDRLELFRVAGHVSCPRCSRLLPLDVPFELGERRPVLRIQHLAAELDRDLRRVALHAGEQRRLDALQLLRALVDLLLDQAAERLDDPVREQDAEEGADQRRADHAAEDRRRLADRAHRVDHAEHRRDDAERRQRAGEPARARSPARAPRGGGSRSRCPSGSRSRAR